MHARRRMNRSITSADIGVLTETADFVVKYGFLAVGLVLIFLIAPVIYKLWGEKRLTFATVCFGLAFIISYGVLSFVSVIAPSWIASPRTIVSGTVLGITSGFQVQLRSDLRQAGQAYTKREIDRDNASISNFPFLLATRDTPGCLAVSVSSTNPDSDEIYAFNITPLSREDLTPDMEIVAKVVSTSAGGVNLRIWRERGQKQVDAPKTLEPLNETTPDCGESRTASVAPSLWSLVGSAFAQGMQTQDLYNSLQSDDVFTRRQARIDLSQKGGDAFQTISDLLGTDAYRLKLGGLVALAGMPDDQRKTAPAGIWDKVRPLLGSSDKTMRDAAVQALREPAYCYQEED